LFAKRINEVFMLNRLAGKQAKLAQTQQELIADAMKQQHEADMHRLAILDGSAKTKLNANKKGGQPD
jgi:hypothetical protein